MGTEDIDSHHRHNGYVPQLLLAAYKSKLTITALFDVIPNSRSQMRRERRRVYAKFNLGYGLRDNSAKERGERASDGITTRFSPGKAANSLPARLITTQCRH